MGVPHPRNEIRSESANHSFGTLNTCVGGTIKWARHTGEKMWKLDIACEHVAHRRRTSITSIQEVEQGVTKQEPYFESGGKQTFELFAP